MGNTLVSFQDVSWRREGRKILNQIDWEIKEGEHWAVLGLNGSGKTSLLNILTAYQFPTTGKVNVLGFEFGNSYLPNLRNELGIVSSSFERFSETLDFETIEEIVVSGEFATIGLYQEVPQAAWEKADALISKFRLDYLKGKEYRHFSQGEKRRVLIARALMNDPKMLILDEPCSGLDILSREEILQLIKEITQHQCHLIYVTHHIEELTEEVTHVLLLREGEIVGAGPKRDVLTEERLSETFKLDVNVHWENGRPWLSVKKPLNI
ncbi:ATP-binding cassette domain-containing protein [Lederbergia sp. NSJ-179]|uniref:ABC transporter ATP-binding protein n=1 Tax=Lederbergia sp. NSJ-179 TaxID=2931402 RepID=UPI001FD573E2|nr:ATP-binding cassette domain-containing protein [Lederbergia sp. NSJ-179]MCJ7840722.1 ATP-binding cassette domain-containing protein [Lederbergia sp. NSJ-179]